MTDAVTLAKLRTEFANITNAHYSSGTATPEGAAEMDRLIEQYGPEAVQDMVDEMETPTIRITDKW
ncbi:hypothetical protein [Streptomyces violascens]|uniref:hypothetical protein n=1 Tax=Streptomyces violascens TaxID=67381 RepID=UPI0016771FE3|nr:hypothetical protein [Streptomyces violascens]GGU51216.1 hypothetical protein GCM10010289_84560 [Streptomyces violascens]